MNLAKEIIDGRTKVTGDEIKILAGMVKDLYYERPNIVPIPNEKVIFVGDLHGDLGAAKTAYEVFLRYKDHSLVFLGDYADRGPYQVETVNFVLALALLHPDKVTLLRGNHESRRVANAYGFYMDALRKHSRELFEVYLDAFVSLPIAGLSSNGIFSCHGGIPEGVSSIDDILSANRYTEDFDDPIIMQLVWNDPIEADVTFRDNIRGANIRSYGRKAFDAFAKNLGVSLMIRAHEVFPEGYETFFDGKLVSVFSTEYNDRVKPKVLRIGKNHEFEPLPIA